MPAIVSNYLPPDGTLYTGKAVIQYAGRGRLKELQELLVYNRSLPEPYKSAALHLAILYEQYSCVELLLNSKAPPNGPTPMGKTPLMVAAKYGHANIIDMLLKFGASTNMQDDGGYNILMQVATLKDRLHIVEKLLKNNASPNIQNKHGSTALMFAAGAGHTDMVEVLLHNGAFTDMEREDGCTAIMLACVGGHYDTVQILLDNYASVYTKHADGTINKTALSYALDGEHEDIMKLLLSHDKTMQTLKCKEGNSILLWAVLKGSVKIVQLLLKHCDSRAIDMQMSDGSTALMWAIEEGHTEIVELLLDHKASTDITRKDGSSAMTLATELNNGYIWKMLLDRGVPINYKSTAGDSLLMIAIIYGFQDQTEYLLKNGAFVDYQAKDGTTALMLAAGKGNQIITQQLLDHDADVHIERQDGTTALIWAATGGHTNTVKMLIKNNARLDVSDINGDTALIEAAKRNDTLTINALLEAGASIKLHNSKHKTALNIALTHNAKDAVSILIEETIKQKFPDNHALLRAVHLGIRNIVDKLLEIPHIDVGISDKQGFTPMIVACNKSDIQTVQKLLKIQTDIVDVRTNTGFTPISIASDKGNIPLLRLLLPHSDLADFDSAAKCGDCASMQVLLERGKDINKTFSNGETACLIASQHGQCEAVRFLLNKGADSSITDQWNNTSLHKAVEAQSPEIVKMLIKCNKSLIHATNVNGWTPLYIAVRTQLYEVVELLMLNGADVDIEDRTGYSPLAYAYMGRQFYHSDEETNGDILGNIERPFPNQNTIKILEGFTEKGPDTADMAFKKIKQIQDANTKNNIVAEKTGKIIRRLRNLHEKSSQSKTPLEQSANPEKLVGTLLYLGMLGKVTQIKLADTIKCQVYTLLKRVVSKITEYDKRIEISIALGGSVAEDTKIGLSDEYDYHFIVKNLDEKVIVEKEMENDVLLRVKEGAESSCTFALSKDRRIRPDWLYMHVHQLICKALSNVDIFDGLDLLFKYIKREQIHLEWRGKELHMMAIKIDVVTVIDLREHSFDKRNEDELYLLQPWPNQYGARVYEKSKSWRPSACKQELATMAQLHAVPKYAYKLCKIANSLLMYTASELPYAVKSYDLKNATFQESERSLVFVPPENEVEFPWDFSFKDVAACAKSICEEGLDRLLCENGGGEAYYFGLSYSRMNKSCVDNLRTMMNVLLSAEAELVVKNVLSAKEWQSYIEQADDDMALAKENWEMKAALRKINKRMKKVLSEEANNTSKQSQEDPRVPPANSSTEKADMQIHGIKDVPTSCDPVNGSEKQGQDIQNISEEVNKNTSKQSQEDHCVPPANSSTEKVGMQIHGIKYVPISCGPVNDWGKQVVNCVNSLNHELMLNIKKIAQRKETFHTQEISEEVNENTRTKGYGDSCIPYPNSSTEKGGMQIHGTKDKSPSYFSVNGSGKPDQDGQDKSLTTAGEVGNQVQKSHNIKTVDQFGKLLDPKADSTLGIKKKETIGKKLKKKGKVFYIQGAPFARYSR